MGNDTETNFNITYTANNTQCVLQPFDDAATYGAELQVEDPPDRGHRPDVERQRARHAQARS